MPLLLPVAAAAGILKSQLTTKSTTQNDYTTELSEILPAAARFPPFVHAHSPSVLALALALLLPLLLADDLALGTLRVREGARA